jgi:erythromycin esterase-like protein
MKFCTNQFDSHSLVIKRFVTLLMFLGAAFSSLAFGSETSPNPRKNTALDQVVRDVCNKQVVFLGEDANHGSGKTFEVKGVIVQRLVDECGFSGVFFESPMYDFLDLNQSLRLGSATPEQFADAIGGLWSTTKEIDPLVAFLFEKAKTGQVKLHGLDLNVAGATQLYSAQHLPALLASYLGDVRSKECENKLSQLTNWRFDAKSDYDDAARENLRTCIAEIGLAIAKRPSTETTENARMMAMNLSRYLDMSHANGRVLRDQTMYDNFVWHRENLPKNTKIIIWTATSHAVKKSSSTKNGFIPLGFYIHQALGKDAAAIGFTAFTGSYKRIGSAPIQLEVADKNTLEAQVFRDSSDEMHYVDHQGLKAFGTITARPITYNKPELIDWSTVLDGLLVLRQERPPEFVRSTKPQQKSKAAQIIK